MEAKKCYVCEVEIANKNLLGLNKKLLGRKIKRFYCIDCMADYFDVTADELLDRIEDFKSQGCGLFE
jgi:hypothetical protein